MTAHSDPTSLIGAALRLVVIETVDLSAATCRVRDGDIVSGDIPWLTARAGATRTWSPPSIGEQCLLLCPEGDMLAAVVLPGLYSDAHPAPGSDDTILIRFADGAVIGYDPVSHVLDATLPAGGKVAIVAPGGVVITGPLRVEGDVTIEGTATASTDVVGGGKSLKGHKHLGVTAGGGVSGLPQ
jgi:phage baseplate assembly protein V